MIKIGKRHVEIATKWLPSLSVFGMAAGLGLCYATDWQLILGNVPFYNGKYKPSSTE